MKKEKLSTALDGQSSVEALASTNAWLLTELPPYEGENPRYAASVYESDVLLTDFDRLDTKCAKVTVVSQTTCEEFFAYIQRLKSLGYKQIDESKIEQNRYVTLTNDSHQVYTYFVANQNRVNIIIDRGSADVSEVSRPMSANDLANTSKSGRSAVFFQYGLDRNYYPHPEKPWDNGLLLVVACADHSIIVFDGGNANQTDFAVLNEFLHDAAGIEKNETVVIASWVVTHLHNDHLYGFVDFMKQFHEQYDLKSICANVPYGIVSRARKGETAVMTNFAPLLNEWYPDCKEIHIHTGQKLQFADVTLQALYTHEDRIDAITGETLLTKVDFNMTGAVFKVVTDGMSMMVLGDGLSYKSEPFDERWEKSTDEYLISTYTEETLKSDIVQVAHHALSGIMEAYEKIQARAYFVPQSREGFLYQNDIYPWFRRLRRQRLEGEIFPQYAEGYGTDDEMIFYIGSFDRTVGLQSVNNKLTVVYNPERQIRKLIPTTGKDE